MSARPPFGKHNSRSKQSNASTGSASTPLSQRNRGRGWGRGRGRGRARYASSAGTSRQTSRPCYSSNSRAPSYIPSSVGSIYQSVQGCNDEAQDLDDLNEVVMAVDMRERNTIGCSYYVAKEEKLYFMEDLKIGDIEIIGQLKTFIEPTVVLLSVRADEAVIKCLDHEGRNRDDELDSLASLPYIFELRPSTEFAYESSREKLINLRIGAHDGPRVEFMVPGDVPMPHEYSDAHDRDMAGAHANLMRLSNWISMDSRFTVGCAGAVLSYLQRRRVARFLPGDAVAQALFRITTLEMFSLRDTMFVNQDTLYSLQVLQSESHPHQHNQGPTKTSSGSKEGLSIYGLFHHQARTPQGKYMLRQYFLRPSLSREIIEERLNGIDVLINPENTASFAQIGKNLRNIPNVKSFLTRLQKGVCAGSKEATIISRSIWRGLMKFTYHVIDIKRIFDELIGANQLTIATMIHEVVQVDAMTHVGRCIAEIVDFEESDIEHRTVVKRGIDEDLDEKKRLYDGLNDLLRTIGLELAREIPEGYPSDLNVVYLPQIGFLVAMPKDEEAGTALWEGDNDDRWERMFSSEEVVYYKTAKMKDMDDYFGDLRSDICDREIEIIHGLAQRILEYQRMLSEASDLCGKLDCLIALAHGAVQHNLCRPHLTDDNVIDIRGGWHPLQALSVPSYVPNDAHLVGGKGTNPIPDRNLETADPTMLIMTGPNHSGKSVYLKQTALIVYMTQIGSFVPAASASIGLTDKILTRISTRESVSRAQSSFMTDLQQISMALKLATPRSLLIIDEFGKGTDNADGAGLACGVLQYLLTLEPAKRPKVLAATHFHEIFEHGFLRRERFANLRFGHMEIRIDQSAADVQEQVTYLYNFREGRSTASFGTCCAAMNGVAPEVVQRAEELVLMIARGEDLVEACAVLPEEVRKELQEAERVAREFLETDVLGNPRAVLNDLLRFRDDVEVIEID